MWMLAAPYKNFRLFVGLFILTLGFFYLLGLQAHKVVEAVYGFEGTAAEITVFLVWGSSYKLAVITQKYLQMGVFAGLAYVFGTAIEDQIHHESIAGSENSYSLMVGRNKILVLFAAVIYSFVVLSFCFICKY